MMKYSRFKTALRFFFSKNACPVPFGCFGVTTRLEVDGSVAEGEERPKGVNMTELADLLIEHGAVEGINLDGGQKNPKKRRFVGNHLTNP